MIITPVDIMSCLPLESGSIDQNCINFVAGFNMATPIMIYITAVLAPIAAAIKIVNMVGND